MRINYTPDAVSELLSISRYYEEKQLGLGSDFNEKLDSLIANCRDNPEMGRVIDGQVRYLVMKKFPYNIIYRLTPDEITIIAAAHQKRFPGYWRGRTIIKPTEW